MAAKVVRGNAIIVPKLHRENAVDDVAGAKKENIIFGVFLKEWAIFVAAAVAHGNFGEISNAAQ